MKIAQLQGTPWHQEQMHRTCNDGSKYCIYNHKICSCISNKQYYHKPCVGKGNCQWFEPKTGTPKIYSSKTYKIKKSEHKNGVIKQMKNTKVQQSTNNNQHQESKEDKFLRVSKGRVNKIEEAISNLANLSDRHSYSYTDEQVNKMFNYIEKKLNDAKDKFKNKSSGGFEW